MFCTALLLRWLRHGLPSVAAGIVVDRDLRVNAEAVAGGVHTHKQRHEMARVSQLMRRRTRAVGGPAEGHM